MAAPNVQFSGPINNPTTIEVPGYGRIQVSGEFDRLSPPDQQAAIDEIAAEYTRSSGGQSTQQPAAAQPPAQDNTQGALPLVGDDTQIPDWLYRNAPGAAIPLEMARDFTVGAAQGAAHVLDNAAEGAQGIYNQTLGRVFGQSHSADQPSEYERLIAPDAPRIGFQGVTDQLPDGNERGRATGEIGAAALLTRGLPGPVTQGAGAGALLSDADTPGGVAIDAVTGAAGGKLAERAVTGLSRLAAPHVPDAVRRLRELGIRLTPGQAVPALRRTEERLTSRPHVGDRIVEGRQQSVRDMNRAAVGEVVAPINAHLTQAGQAPIRAAGEGHAAVRSVGDQLSNRYEALVPSLRLVPDQELAADVQSLGQTLASGDMSREAIGRFETIVRSQVMDRLNGSNPLSGEAYRQIERSISKAMRRFGRSDAPDDQAMVEALGEVQSMFQRALQRSNPHAAAELRALNDSWANLVIVEQAASGAKGGLFSPLQLRQAVRRGDTRTRGRGMARGEARMQQLAEDASDVLPSSYPDSGTAGRSQDNVFDPRYWMGMAQGQMYGPQAQQLITNALAGQRPAFARTFADTLEKLPAAQIGATLAVPAVNDLLRGR